MNNRADGNPFERQFFPDPNIMRQQMNAQYGLSQNPLLSPHHYPSQQDMFQGLTRRPPYTSADLHDHSMPVQRSNALQSTPNLLGTTPSNPWMLPYSPTNVMNPDFPMGVSPMLTNRWTHEQNALLSTQGRDPHALTSQYRQESALYALHQREAQMREAQLHRGREALFQREQEAMMQREREVQMQREVELREQEARLQREKELQLQQEREREAQMQQEQQERDQKAARAHKEFMFLQQSSQFQSSPHDYRATSLMNFNFSSPQVNQQMGMVHSRTSTCPSLANYQLSQGHPKSSQSALSEITKLTPTNSSQIHFPHTSTIPSEISNSLSFSNLLKKNPSFEDTLLNNIDLNYRDRSLYDQSSNPYPKVDDIDLTIDRHLSAISMDYQKEELNATCNNHSVKDDSITFASVLGTPISSTEDALHHNTDLNGISVSQTPISRTTEVPQTDVLKSTVKEDPNKATTTTQPITFSQSNTVQVTQNSSVNINININMPNHPAFPFSLSDLPVSLSNSSTNKPIMSSTAEIPRVESSLKSTVIQAAKTNSQDGTAAQEHMEFKTDGNLSSDVKTSNEKTNVVISPSFTSSVSYAAASSIQAKQKTNQSYSSIESFLGMTTAKSYEKTEPTQPDNFELKTSAMEHGDRISVIKPVATAQIESDDSTKMQDNSSKTEETNTNVVVTKEQEKVTSTNKNSMQSPVPLPMHPSMRFKNNQKNAKQKLKQVNERKQPSKTSEGRPVHPSMRLKQNAKSSLEDVDNNCLPIKTARYQSEMVKSKPASRSDHKSSPIGGKPANYNVSVGKPATSVPGGKPSSYSTSIMGAKTVSPVTGGKPVTTPTGGKPLSYFKSICDNKESGLETEKGKGKVRGPKVNKGEKTVVKKTASKEIISRKAVNKGLPKENESNTHDDVAQISKKVVLPNLQHNASTNKRKELNSLISPSATSSPEMKRQKVQHNPPTGGKPFQFKKITFDSKSSQESDSGSDSDSSTSSSSEDEGIQDSDNASVNELDNSTFNSSFSQDSQDEVGSKRKHEAKNNDVIAALKKRKVVDEELIKVPLRCGWRRQTRLRPATTGEGLRGDVYYYSPCGKKLRTYPELHSYMLKNEIEDVKLQNFSFSTKLKVGDFLEAKQGSKLEKLTEEQIDERFSAMKERVRLTQERLQDKREKKKAQAEKAQKLQEEKNKKKVEREEEKKRKEDERRQAIKEKALEARRKKEQEREAAREAKRLRTESILAEKRKLKEDREKERLMKLEEQRIRKEKKQQAIENEREMKRQQLEMNKAQEKEQRKRELIMMKAYESQRRAQERERLREQKRLEKMLLRQRKLEQKRYEKLIARELKKPIDDLALNDLKPLPDLPVVPNLNIPGQAFADLMMVAEFIHSFGHVIDIDVEKEFPSMAELQSSLLCEPSSEDALYTACQALLFYALYDPGVSGKHASTILGVNLQNVELTENNISEILRLFILCRNDGRTHTLSDQLKDRPLVSLSPSHKAATLAFLCNELLCGKAIGRDIENHLDNMSNLRRNKWTLEGEMRKLKVDICKRKPKSLTVEKKAVKPASAHQDEESRVEDDKESDDDKDSDEDDVSQDYTGNQEDGADDDVDLTNEVTDPQNVEQMGKKLKQMEKKHAKFRGQLINASHTVRGVYLGQDRYKRRYFVLPNAGGVYIEGLESGYFDEELSAATEMKKEEAKEKIGTLLTSLKSPTTITSSVVKLESLTDEHDGNHMKVCDSTSSELRTNAQACSTAATLLHKGHISVSSANKTMTSTSVSTSNTTTPGHAKTTEVKNYKSKWFPLSKRINCEDTSSVDPLEKKKSVIDDIVAPNVRLLSEDHQFLESIYSYYSQSESKIQSTPYSKPYNSSLQNNSMKTCALFGLPPELDINLLIQQDPQKAAEILEIQTAVPQQVPDDKKIGWWRITEPDQLQRIIKAAHPRGMRERALQKAVARYGDYINTSCKINKPSFSLVLPEDEMENKEDMKTVPLKPENDIKDQWSPQLAYASDKAALMEVEELEEKVFSASLQVKGWRLSQKSSSNLRLNVSIEYKPSEEEHPLHIAIARLLALEAGIERRYLKHPFRVEKVNVPANKAETETSKDENLKNSNVQVITPALRLWREAVSEATSAAQLSMCITMLLDCVAWDKSIMKVFCILCRKSDNEERLLLCDACDRGCHTYCCNPKLESIPEGDWFCQECILMASGSDQCYKCKGKSGKRLKCGFCPRYYHMQCLEPPLQKTPRSPWACPVCKKARSKTKTPQVRKQPRVEEVAKQENNKPVSHTSRKQLCKDMEPCRQMLNELESHEYAWPFLVPVNPKQFPEYYKIIRHPMDFHTMKMKLRDYAYKSRDEFAHDARRVFINCNTFNEDESEVGRAGKAMSTFFEKRWSEVLKSEESRATQEKKPTNEKPQSSDEEEESSSSEEISSESESSVMEESDDESKN